MLKQRQEATYVLNMLRHSARKRALEFTLTVEQFKSWCAQTGYLQKRGTKTTGLTVDRIDHSKGYHIWNITTATHLENSTRGHTVPDQYRKQNHRRDQEPPEHEHEHSESQSDPF